MPKIPLATQFLGPSIVRDIQRGTPATVRRVVTEAALYIACGGATAAAGRLHAALVRLKLGADGNLWASEQALFVVWTTAGIATHGLPTRPPDIETIRSTWLARHSTYDPTPTARQRALQELSGPHLFRAIIEKITRMQEVPGGLRADLRPLDEAAVAEIHDALVRLVESDAVGPVYEPACALLADFAARLGNATRVEWSTKRWWSWSARCGRLNLTGIATVPAIAERLAAGLLADELGLTAQVIEERERALVEALDARAAGRKPSKPKPLSMKELVADIDRLGRAVAESLLRPPASPAVLARAEKRLKCKLPDDYRAFLAVSNGLGRVKGRTPALLEISAVRRASDAIPDAIADVYSESVPLWKKVSARGLELGEPCEEHVWLLPDKSKPGKVWEYATWRLEGPSEHAGFRAYLEHVRETLLRESGG